MAPSYSGVWKTQTIYQYINDNFGKSFQSASLGSEAVFEDSTTEFPDVCFDSTNNRIVVAYFDDADSDKGKAAVGTVSSDGSISFGTPVVFESGAALEGNSGKISIVHDSNADRVAIFYTDASNSYYGTAAIGTVDSSDNSISFGTPVVFQSSGNYGVAATFDTNSNKVIISYRDYDNSKSRIIEGTVSGTSISFGSSTILNNAAVQQYDLNNAFDSNVNKTISVYRDDGNSNYGAAIAYTSEGYYV